ncbi:MAG: BadF/BadG/BcrA/BcrD ATPase family protein [Paracoccaceae bacterium]
MVDVREILLVGVDGGGTGCRAAIARGDLSILAQAEGGRANVSTDFKLAVQNVLEVIKDAALKAGISIDELHSASVHLGLAGVISDDIAKRVTRALPYPAVTATDDRLTTVAGALGEHDGFLVAVGTGTIVAARQVDTIRCVGGWGFHVSDQASGARLGRRLLEETLLCYDNIRAHSDLTRSTLAKFHGDPNRIVDFSVDAKPGDYGRFAPDVVVAAKADDVVGREIMIEGAAYLERGLQTLGFEAGDRLCLAGGIGVHYLPLLSDEFIRNVVAPLASPVMGAVRLAAMSAAQRSQVAS